MISGVTRGSGGPKLGNHVAKTDENEAVFAAESRGLISEDIKGQVAELTRLGSHARTSTPIYHVHLDPPAGRPFTEAERARYWELFEKEFGFERQPFASQMHLKLGRGHEHRQYLRIRTNGTAIRLDNDFARREKLSRIMEFERGEPFTKGSHNKAVIQALETKRPEIAAALKVAKLHEGPPARAPLSSKDRTQQDRTKVQKADVAAAVAAAWQHSDNGPAFSAALSEHSLRLAQGDKCPVIVDASGNTHGVLKMLGMQARADGTKAPKAADIMNRLDGIDLPTVAEAKQQPVPDIQVQQPAPVQPESEPPPPAAQHISPSRDNIPELDPTQAEPPAPAAAASVATVPSRDGGAATPTTSAPSGRSGGGSEGAAPAAPEQAVFHDGGAGGDPTAGLEIPKPGDILGEIRYRAAVAKKAQQIADAAARNVAPAPKQKSWGGNHYGTVQNQAAAEFTGIGQTATWRADTGGSRYDGGASRQWSTNSGGDEGGPSHGTNSREYPGADAGADGGREHAAGRREDLAGSNMHKAGDHGRQAFQHRIALARATRALGSVDLSGLIDRLEPDRIVRRIIQKEHERVVLRRAEAPFPDPLARDADLAARVAKFVLFSPMHEAQEELKLALARQESVYPISWKARFTPWETPVEREHRKARDAVSTAHAAVAAATPSRNRIDDVVHLARTRAHSAARAHSEWQRGTGQELDCTEHLLIGITAAMDGGDRIMRRAILDGGIEAALRLRAERETVAEPERRRNQAEESNVVGFRPR